MLCRCSCSASSAPGSVLISRIERTNQITTKGDRTYTTLLMFDEAGRVQ